MTFDKDSFTADIQAMRKIWMRPIREDIAATADLGWFALTSQDGAHAPFRPFIYHAQKEVASSKHRELQDQAWTAEVLDVIERMTLNLKQIPAFDYPAFSWGIGFKGSAPTKSEANPLPAFQISILGANLTKSKVKTTAATLKRLYEIRDDVATVPKPVASRVFQIWGEIIQADCPETVAHVFAALHQPLMLGKRKAPSNAELPQIIEVFDQGALMAHLRTL